MASNFALSIPLDASAIEGFKPEQPVKVVVKDAKTTQSQVVQLSDKGLGSASFSFDEKPSSLQVLVGPGNATDEEMPGLQTLSINISARQLGDQVQAKLPAITIAPYYWWWWLESCREWVIRGRVLCPDDSPVPGAKVCAFDVDWWFIWYSTQQVGCAFTDINGAFEIRFRWCCGWWPWWWWRLRSWELSSVLTEQVATVLKRNPDLRLTPPKGNQPTLAVFDELLAREGLPTGKILDHSDARTLDQVREKLIKALPVAPELEKLRIWPWYQWQPWWDCRPDIIFRVTQDCVTPNVVIVDETVGNTRWDISNPLSVTLTANERACCHKRCPEPPCDGGECLVITEVCNAPITDIAGNTGAPPAPDGYLYPGAVVPGTVNSNGDRPFAGTIPVWKNFGAMVNVDYYEIEYFNGAWVPLPPGAAVNFTRKWMHLLPPLFPHADVPFNFTTISGHLVVESKEHWEANSGLAPWGSGANPYIWIENEYLVLPLDTTKFPDGPYHFRVVGWQLAGVNLRNPRPLPICGTKVDNSLVLRFDNRVIDSLTHDPSHMCGVVHICTVEPDTHIIQVLINGAPVSACGTAPAATGNLEIEFLVTDPDGHLAEYTLHATYGLNQATDLLALATSVTPVVPGTPTGWLAGQSRATYGVALGQGAVAPQWGGGRYRLTVPAAAAFPRPCCYQLELRGWKRTVVGGGYACDMGYAHWNITEYTLGVAVCPPVIG